MLAAVPRPAMQVGAEDATLRRHYEAAADEGRYDRVIGRNAAVAG